MSLTMDEFWDKLNVNKEEVLERFVGMPDIAKDCTISYIEDPLADELEKAVEAEDYPAIERAAHTIKGLAGNLGFEAAQNSAQKIVDFTRAGEYDKIPAEFLVFKAEHDKIAVLAKEL